MNFKPNKTEREREKEQEFLIHFDVFCVIIVKYKEISWRVRRKKEKRWKKVTSRSTEKTRA